MDDMEVVAATLEDRTVFRNLMHLYLYDFSEYTGDDVDENGFFEDEYLDRYWVEPARYPFLVKVEGHYAGFVMVRDMGAFEIEGQGTERTYSIAEFFVMKKYRRRGIGKRLAFAIFDRFHGRWWVSQEMPNVPAQQFWRRVIGEYTGGSYTEFVEPREKRPTQVFTSPGISGASATEP